MVPVLLFACFSALFCYILKIFPYFAITDCYRVGLCFAIQNHSELVPALPAAMSAIWAICQTLAEQRVKGLDKQVPYDSFAEKLQFLQRLRPVLSSGLLIAVLLHFC